MAEQRRKVGAVTGAASVGGALGASLAQVLVHFAPSLAEIETPLTVIITLLLSLFGGYLAPPQEERDKVLDLEYDSDEEPLGDEEADLDETAEVLDEEELLE